MSWTYLLLMTTVCVALLVSGAWAADQPLFQDDFRTSRSLRDWALLPPVDALGPIPGNGEWKVGQGALVATGTAKPWTIRTAGDATWGDYKVSAQVTIQKPGPKSDFPIFHAEWDRYLPREWFPPLCDHTGQYRFRYYAGEFDWGSDAGVWFRYQDRENCYRVQLSNEYQEMILWHGIGGYLAVVPCKVEPGKAYKLEILAQGPHLQVLLNGKKKIDYWHECLPTLTGKIGVGAYQATAAFDNVSVAALPPPPATPQHQANFSTRQWRGTRWIFDGGEPIVLLEKGRPQPEPGYCTEMLSYYFVKLRPGYRPMYQAWVGVRPDYPESSGNALVGTVDDIATTGENSDELAITFNTAQLGGTMKAVNTDTLTYDAVRGTYRHDMVNQITWLQEAKMPFLEFCDPLTYNNKEPGLSNKYRWLPAGHQWGVFLNEDDTIRRHPISQSLNMEGQNNWYTNPGHSYWVLTPDRAVCPAWEHLTPEMKCNIGVCHWGYDWHQYVYWGWDKQRTFQPGEEYTVHYVMTGYTPAEGEKLFLASTLHPAVENPEPEGKHFGFLQVPSELSYPVVEPAGTSFDKLYDARVPYIGWQWYGDYDNERQVGRTDRYSMRIDGPAKVNGQFYHHMIDGNAQRYLCTFWLNTKGVRGPAPVAVLQYPWNEKLHKDIIDTGLVGDNDWTEFSFITTVPVITAETYDSSEFNLECRGVGTVWLDDWSVRPLADDEQVAEKRGGALPVSETMSADFLLDLPCTEGAGQSLWDASGHNNNGKAHSVTWVKAGDRWALHFDGKDSAAYVPLPSPELKPGEKGAYQQEGLTLEAWVRPTAKMPGGAILGYGNSPIIQLQANGDNFQAIFGCGDDSKGYTQLLSKPEIVAEQWAHVAATISPDGHARLYVNGNLAEDKVMGGKINFTSWYPAISIGNYGKMGSLYAGDLTGLRWWSRAATEEEIVAARGKDRPG